jgi:DNA-binding response OmpR family regulator
MSEPGRAPRILLVDDDRALLDLMALTLIEGDYEVTTALDGEKALAVLHAEPVDAVVCDVSMPNMDGLEFCRRVRSEGRTVPILLATALGSEADEATGLASGADDYLTKPFRMRLLLGRIDALLRYDVPKHRAPVHIGELRIDGGAVMLGRRSIGATPPEIRLLEALVGRIGELVDNDTLLQAVRGVDVGPDHVVADLHVRRLRRKFEEADPAFDRIESVAGLGVRWRKD